MTRQERARALASQLESGWHGGYDAIGPGSGAATPLKR